jgi:PAS domain S-box-containing protein
LDNGYGVPLIENENGAVLGNRGRTADVVLDASIEAELSTRQLADTRSTLVMHPMAAVLVVLLFWQEGFAWQAAALLGLVGTGTLIRWLLWRRARWEFDTATVFRWLRWGTAATAVAWGIATFLLRMTGTGLDAGHVSMIFAGFVASAIATQVAHPRMFHTFTTVLLGSFLLSLVLIAPDVHSVRAALLVAGFWGVVTFLYRRAHRELVDSMAVALRLRESEAEAARKRHHLAALLQSVPHGVLILDATGRVFHVSAAFERMFGESESEIVGLTMSALAERTESLAALAAVAEQAASGVSFAQDLEITTAAGEHRELRVAVEHGVGAADGALVIATEDVTTLRQAERARMEAERQYREILEAARDLVWRMDVDGRWTFLNETGVADIYRGSRDAMLGHSFLEVVAPERQAGDRNTFAQVFSGDELTDVETLHVRADGSRVRLSFSARPLRNAQGQIVGAEGTARDVTERAAHREAMERVIEQDALIRALLNGSPDLISLKDEEGVYRSMNGALERMTGMTEAEVLGRIDADLFSSEDANRQAETDRQAYAERRSITYDEWRTTVTGERRRFHVVKTPQFDPHGRPLGLIAIARDVTEFHEAQERAKLLAREAEHANHMKSAFLANMSHEIRTPMNGVLGMTEILLDTPLTPEQRQAAETVQTSAESLLALLNDILDLSKIEAGHLEIESVPFDVAETVTQAARTLAPAAAKKCTDMVVDVGSEVPAVVCGDPMRLRQVLVNLMGNAVKFTNEGEVVVTVAVERAHEGLVWLRFSVRDTGCGIPEDRLERIFEAFSQADVSTSRVHGGTGLGLTICRQIVHHMNGEITVRSTVGEGSEFEFVIALKEVEGELPNGVSGELPSFAGLRVLVVDDNTTNRRVMRRVMERASARVDEAEDGLRALSLLRKGHEDKDEFGAVLLDDRIGEGRGVDVLAAMKSDPALASIPTLLLSSGARPGETQRARALGVGGFLSKPVRRQDLLMALWHLLRDGHADGGNGASAPKPAQRTVPHRVGLRILLAEDNAVNQQVAIALLEKRGHRVDVAQNGREAVELACAHRYDVVLMDVRMPEMDGIEATHKLRVLPATVDLPIIALTAHALREERERCLAAGMNDFLSKPFRPLELFTMVERWAPLDGVREPVTNPAEEQRQDERQPDVGPPVDIEGFRAAMREVGVESVVDAAVALFVRDAPDRMDAVRTAIAAADAGRIDTAAHAFKSGAGSIRAVRLAALLGEIEARAEAADIETARALAPKLEAEYDAVMGYLRGELAER